MTKRFSYILLLFFYFVLLSFFSKAQNTTVVKASVDKSKILIGEQIRLTLEADIPESQPIRFFSLDSLPHFEILNAGKTDTTNTRTGTILSRVIQLTSFDSGQWVIPPFYLYENLGTDSLTIDVMFSAFDTAQAYHDIKDIIEVSPPKEEKMQWWWFAVAAALILIVILIIALNKKKKPAPVAIVEKPNPYKIALEKLQALQQSNVEAKEYYTRLVDIFRVYVDEKKGIHSLQQTSDDIIVQLKKLNMPEGVFSKLSQSLQLSDWVKFAKYTPTEAETQKVYEDIKNAITTIEQIQ